MIIKINIYLQNCKIYLINITHSGKFGQIKTYSYYCPLSPGGGIIMKSLINDLKY